MGINQFQSLDTWVKELLFIKTKGAGKMAQSINVNPDDLNSVPGSDMVE